MSLKLTTMLVSALILAPVEPASAEDPSQICIEYARTVASELRLKVGYGSVEAWRYHHECGSENSQSGSSESLAIGIPEILTADGEGRRNQGKSKEWCKKNAHLATAAVLSYEYNDTVVRPAMELLRSCAEAYASNIRVEPRLSVDRTVLDIGLTNNTGNADLTVSMPTYRGEASCNLSFGQKTEDGSRVLLPLKRTVSFHCERPTVIPQDGLETAVISIVSDGLPTPLQFHLPPIGRQELLSDEFRDLSRKLSLLSDAFEGSLPLCEHPADECICQTDSGTDKAKLVVCIKRCPDGRVAGLSIPELDATSKSVSCQYEASKAWN